MTMTIQAQPPAGRQSRRAPGYGPLPAMVAYPMALAAGLLASLSFEPVAIGQLAPVAVALLVIAVLGSTGRRGFALGLCFGGAFFGPLLHWLTIVGTDAWIGLAAFCSLWTGLMGLAIAVVTRLPGWPVWVAGVWMLQEALRGRIPLGGFPWGNLAYGQPDTSLGRLAWLVGQPGVGFATVLVGCAIVAAALALRAGARRVAVGWSVVALVLLAGPVLLRLPTSGDTVGGAPAAVIAAVQGGTPQTGMGAMDVRRAVLTNHVDQTLMLADRIRQGQDEQPAFVLWPENASDIDPFADPTAAAAISGAAQAVGAPILVGAVVNDPANPSGVLNLGVVWDPVLGPGQRYVKTHPVPFGEYVPFRSLLASLVGRFDRIPRDFVPGTVPGNMQIGGIAVGDVICFEIVYDDVIDPIIANGARIITVQTNNATYQGTAQPAQQLAIERMRAIQTGRAVVVAATSGISAVITPDGSVREQLAEGSVGSLDGPVPLRGEPSPSTRIGTAGGWALALIGLGPIAWSVLSAVRRRRRPADLKRDVG